MNRSFTAKTKLEAVKFAKDNSKAAAARKYGVDAKSIREWTHREQLLEAQLSEPHGSKRKRLEGGGRKPLSLEMEAKIMDWIIEMRAKSCRVSRLMIQDQARKICPTLNVGNSSDLFEASKGWVDRFMKRNNLSVRKRTTIAQKDPVNLGTRAMSFLKFVADEKTKFGFEDDQIVNMDETAAWFDMISNSTVDIQGTKSIGIQGTGHEKSHYTVCLAAKADGSKLKPMIVFKGATREVKSMQDIPGVIVVSNSNGWMDDELTKVWLEKSFGSLSFKKRLLVWDSYRAHISVSTKKHLRNFNTNVAVIPGGCTKYLQPADVSWNKGFKKSLDDSYSTWMATEGNKTFTKGGNMRAASRRTIVDWVKKAWEDLPSELIKKSFKVCGISTNNTGSEDNLIHFLKDPKFAETAELLSKFRSGHSEVEVEVLEEEEDEEENEQNEVLIDCDSFM